MYKLAIKMNHSLFKLQSSFCIIIIIEAILKDVRIHAALLKTTFLEQKKI